MNCAHIHTTIIMFPHRIAVWRDTKDYADCIPPPPRSQKFRWAANDQWNRASVGMKVSVKDIDCLVACKHLIDAGGNPVVLNLADILVPGGCVESGSGAQEESIFRRSNYVRTLTHDFYPLHPDEAVYSADVTVFRAPESQGHVFLSDPFKVAMIACPGLYRPQVDSSGRLTAKMVQRLEQKLDLILKLAACFGHDSVVLGAMGCGGKHGLIYTVAVLTCMQMQMHVCTLQRGKTLQQRWQLCLLVSYRETAGGCSKLLWPASTQAIRAWRKTPICLKKPTISSSMRHCYQTQTHLQKRKRPKRIQKQKQQSARCKQCNINQGSL